MCSLRNKRKNRKGGNMTEKEKGKAGLFYNPNYDPELTKER